MEHFVNIYLEDSDTHEKKLLRSHPLDSAEDSVYDFLDEYFRPLTDTGEEDADADADDGFHALTKYAIQDMLSDLYSDINEARESMAADGEARERLATAIAQEAARKVLAGKGKEGELVRGLMAARERLAEIYSEESANDDLIESLIDTARELEWYHDLLESFEEQSYMSDFCGLWCAFV